MSARRTDDAATVEAQAPSRRPRVSGKSGASAPGSPVLEERVKDLEEQLEEFETAFFSLGVALVHGYFVKVWEDPSGEWIAHCPTVRCVAQEDTREAVLQAIADDIEDVVQALDDLGRTVPREDVPCGR